MPKYTIRTLAHRNVDVEAKNLEEAYRKALTFDPDFVLGKGIVGKITTNLQERQSILKQLQAKKEHVSDDERLLLDDLLSICFGNNSKILSEDIHYDKFE